MVTMLVGFEIMRTFARGTTLRFLLLGLTFLGLMGALALGTQAVHAHGKFERSDPRPDAILGNAPNQVVVVLSEAVDPVLIEIRVYNTVGDRVDEGGTRQTDDHSMATKLGPLEPGIFTVAWETVSQADGHRSSDVFGLTVSGGGRLFLGSPPAGVSAGLETRPTPVNTEVCRLVGGGKLAGLLDLHYLVAAMGFTRARLCAQDGGSAILAFVAFA
jgi:methionine-rich copper-binding protein CopC